ncbi:MAG: protocatechuate 3,4-dioxygenase subunit beta [Trueperaceae bacterium]
MPDDRVPDVDVAPLDAPLADDSTIGSVRARGMQRRREVLGNAHVDRAERNKTEFDASFQEFITRYAWGEAWQRTAIDTRTRHLVVLALMAALGREEEFAMHVRAIRNTGVDQEELQDVLHLVAIYAGVPLANGAFRLAKDALAETEVTETRAAASQSAAPSPAPSNDAGRRNARRNGEPLGERIIVTGRVLDEAGRPVRNALLEVWQANAAGRYIRKKDQHDAPLDPNFDGFGRVLTDADGTYRFTSIKPGAYPWRNHHNAWRPPHIHFSVFGRNFHSRLVTQMYFPGDPLLAFDPIYQGIPDEAARQRLISHFDRDTTTPEWALGYRFDIVLAGGLRTWFEKEH